MPIEISATVYTCTKINPYFLAKASRSEQMKILVQPLVYFVAW